MTATDEEERKKYGTAVYNICNSHVFLHYWTLLIFEISRCRNTNILSHLIYLLMLLNLLVFRIQFIAEIFNRDVMKSMRTTLLIFFLLFFVWATQQLQALSVTISEIILNALQRADRQLDEWTNKHMIMWIFHLSNDFTLRFLKKVIC